MTRLAALIAVLAAGFTLFYIHARTPAPAPVNAPATAFSAGRAMGDIEAMGAVPHPVGSAADHAATAWLVRRMSAMGLSPRVQTDEIGRAYAAGDERWVGGGRVENVIGVLKGRDPAAPALALMAHHDSVPGSPGAADDITGVADALEIVRAIAASGPPLRDVMLVITDGEEVDLTGAQAFFADDPAARHVGFVLNLEARGGGGKAAMFETGPQNGGAIALFRRTTRDGLANSLTGFIYKQLPNDTDYTVAKSAGVPGLNFAFIGRQFDYHSPSSTVAALDQGSVQQMGDEALGPARALANSAALPAKAPDAVYGNLVGSWIVAYPTWAGWILLAAIAGLIAWAWVRARRAGEATWADLLQGAGASLVFVALAALFQHLARHATGVGFGWIEGRALLARFPHYEVSIALAALAAALAVTLALAIGEMRLAAVLTALAGAGAAFAMGGADDVAAYVEAAIVAIGGAIFLGRTATLTGAWIGAMVLALAIAVCLQAFAPTTAFVVAWPLAAAAIVANLIAPSARVPAAARWSVALVVIVLVIAWCASLMHLLLQALDLPELPALPAWLAMLALWPLVWPRESLKGANAALAVLAAAGAAAIALWLQFTSPWSARYPDITEPLYVRGGTRAWRASPFEPDAWTRGVLTAEGSPVVRLEFQAFRKPLWAAPARVFDVPTPKIEVGRAADSGVTVHVTMDPRTVLRLKLKTDTTVTAGAVEGRPTPILTQPGAWTHIDWQAAPDLSVSFKPVGHGALDLAWAAYTPGWPAGETRPPANPVILMPWDEAGASVATGTSRVGW